MFIVAYLAGFALAATVENGFDLLNIMSANNLANMRQSESHSGKV